MSLINAGREVNRDHLIKPMIIYIGSVVDNNDKRRLQRVQVRIHDIHRQVPDEQLPWCLPLANLFGSNAGIGQMGPIPTKGSRVYISYLDDSPYFPVYIGGTVSIDRRLKDFTDDEHDDDGLAADYPNVYGVIDRSGNRWYFNTETDIFEFKHVSGSVLSIDGDGRVRFRIADQAVGPNARQKWNPGIEFQVQGDYVVKATRDIIFQAGGRFEAHAQGASKIHSGGNMDAAAPRIDLNTNSPSPLAPDIEAPVARKRPTEEPLENELEY